MGSQQRSIVRNSYTTVAVRKLKLAIHKANIIEIEWTAIVGNVSIYERYVPPFDSVQDLPWGYQN